MARRVHVLVQNSQDTDGLIVEAVENDVAAHDQPTHSRRRRAKGRTELAFP
jgi:hypothetical protein